MRIHKKIGTKERLFEMFENVNKVNLNESYVDTLSNEVGTDSVIFKILFTYISKNTITEEEFQVGELTVQIEANPITWDEPSYQAATQIQPEEGGYPENVQGEISDIVIWDRNDNEYKLSSDALQKLNQKVQFDGKVLEDITEKAINVDGEDEYSRADFARKDSLENEGIIKEEQSDEELHQEIYNELEMRYSNSLKTIPHNDITDVSQMYNVDDEYIINVAANVIADINNMVNTENEEELDDIFNRFLKDLDEKNIDYTQHDFNTLYDIMNHEYAISGGDWSKGDVKLAWDKKTKDPNQRNMFETSYYDLNKKTGVVDKMEGIKFKYDQKGNWIPEGYEDKKIALRSLEQPLGSDNWKVVVVTLDINGELDDIIKVTDSWEEGKNALHTSIT